MVKPVTTTYPEVTQHPKAAPRARQLEEIKKKIKDEHDRRDKLLRGLQTTAPANTEAIRQKALAGERIMEEPQHTVESKDYRESVERERVLLPWQAEVEQALQTDIRAAAAEVCATEFPLVKEAVEKHIAPGLAAAATEGEKLRLRFQDLTDKGYPWEAHIRPGFWFGRLGKISEQDSFINIWAREMVEYRLLGRGLARSLGFLVD